MTSRSCRFVLLQACRRSFTSTVLSTNFHNYLIIFNRETFCHKNFLTMQKRFFPVSLHNNNILSLKCSLLSVATPRRLLFFRFPHLDSIRRDTPYLSIFIPKAGKYGSEKLRIRKLSTQRLFISQFKPSFDITYYKWLLCWYNFMYMFSSDWVAKLTSCFKLAINKFNTCKRDCHKITTKHFRFAF